MKMKMTCIEIEQMEGFYVVRFQLSSLDPTLYIDGMVGMQIDSPEGFEVGKDYDMNLNKV